MMEKILEFLTNYWQLILVCLIMVIDLLITIFKKKTSISTDGLNKVLMALPSYICEAEDFYGQGHGKEKFLHAFNKAMSALKEVYSDDVIKEHGFSLVLSVAIENILNTPEKK